MSKSTYLQKKVLAEHISVGAFLALYTNQPGDDADGDEVAKAGYQRQPVPFSQPTRRKALMMCENTAAVEFSAISGGYGTVTHVALFDAQAGGNLLYYAELNSTIRSADSDKGIVFPAGDLKVAED